MRVKINEPVNMSICRLLCHFLHCKIQILDRSFVYINFLEDHHSTALNFVFHQHDRIQKFLQRIAHCRSLQFLLVHANLLADFLISFRVDFQILRFVVSSSN